MARAFRIFAALAVLICFGWSQAQAQVPLTGAGRGAPGAAPAYTGPGDCSGCAASPLMWGGLRAFSAATRGTKAARICDPTGAVCADWNTDATSGKLLATTNPLNGTDCTAVTTCVIATIYDQTGSLNCGGAACDLTQATNSARPTLTWSCQNAMPCAVFGATKFLQPPNLTTSNPTAFTYSLVAAANAADNGVQLMLSGAPSGASVSAFTPNTLKLFDVSFSAGVTVTAGTFHGIQGVFNGASSDLNINGTTNTVNVGASALATGNLIRLGDGSSAEMVTEAGIWSVAFSGSQSTAMNTNQQAFWAY